MDYALSGGYQAAGRLPRGTRWRPRIGSSNGVISGKFDFDISDAFRVKTMLRANRTRATTPTRITIPARPSSVRRWHRRIHEQDFIGSLRAEYDALDGHLLSAASVQRVDAKRDADGAFGPSGDKGERTRYGIEIHAAGWREVFDAAPAHVGRGSRGDGFTEYAGLLGPAGREARHRQHRHRGGIHAAGEPALGFGASLRHDDNSRFKDANTYRVQGSYLFDNGTRVRAASGSGVKNPSLTELFGYDPASYVGNPDLKPEKSRGWEAGLDQELLDGRMLLGATYFHSRLENEIYTANGPARITFPRPTIAQRCRNRRASS